MSIITKSANVVGFLLVVTIAVILVLQNLSYFQNSNNQNTESKNATETYLAPAVFTFGIWFLILPLLLGFIIYQWFEGEDGAVDRGVSYYFFCQAILNVVWLILWEFALYLAVAIVQLIILILFFIIYFNLITHYEPKGIESICLVYPFSILTPWNLYALFLEIWIAIPALNTVILTVIVLVLLTIFGLYFVDYCWRRDNLFAFAIIWVLVGIAVNNVENMPVYATALAGIGLISGGIFRNWFSFTKDWRSSVDFIETGGGSAYEPSFAFRNYRTDQQYGSSGPHMPEMYGRQ
ncbi:7319_t:CDS:2 [Racocetra persica]|uniref:7319_t:CDS:1 n=1 Tax=Racocetra persica TaxID=160502 RepID=A0ACA9RHQ9_9GLOM|nr:7319_t:CDS:2 [Racocetra persica]